MRRRAVADRHQNQVAIVALGRIAEPTFQFAPADTVFLSVATVGSPDTAALRAVVIGQNGKAVDSTAQTIKPQGHATTPLRLAPEKGWKPGTYRLTLYNNGDSVDAKTFAVQAPQK